MNLDVRNWGHFLIGDLFAFSRGKTLSLENKDIYKGSIPCINGSAENNGFLCGLSSEIEEIGFKKQLAPALSLSRVGGSGMTFYQPQDFYIADNAFALHLKVQRNEYVYLFLSTILNKEVIKYSYGRTISIEKYIKTKIKLPITSNGSPDWDFMERYIKSLHYKPITTAKKTSCFSLNTNEWHFFTLGELFKFQKGKRLIKSDMISGNINFLGAISENNGVRDKIDTDEIWQPNCITVNYNGSVGEAFYQEEPFWASDDVNVLYAKDWQMNKYNALFLCTLIKQERYKFTYGRKWTLDKMKESAIKLPITADGTPDWLFMENYIKSLPYSDRI